jgi:ribosomal-protein-alanine N-acetyltransferase
MVQLLSLNPLTEALLPAVVELDRQVLGGLWSLDGYQRELESPVSDLLVLQSAPEHHEPVSGPASDPMPSVLGFACLWAIADEAHIVTLMVHPIVQGQGLGQALLTALMAQAWQRQLARATLEVRASNQPALCLYEKFGFQQLGQRRNYYQDNGEDALILWRKGLQDPQFSETLTRWHQQAGDRLGQHGWQLTGFGSVIA